MPNPATIHDLPTPSLLLEHTILTRNITRMSEKVRNLGSRLRPHVKTHKCIEIGRLQRTAGAHGITVATIVEARDFANHGFDDITWAVPVPLSRLDEVVALAKRTTFRVLVDSAEAVRAVEAAGRKAGIRIHTWLEVDCGYHRSGVDPHAAASLQLAREIAASPHLVFDGLLTHAGHSYSTRDPQVRARIAAEERDVTVTFAEALRAGGIEVPVVSIGSTPSMASITSLASVSEVRPGNYVFNDFMQVVAGVCSADDVPVSVLTTVISSRSDLPHCIVDAGALAMSKDPGPPQVDQRRGLGPVYTGLTGTGLEPSVNLAHVSQEHGFVEGRHYGVGTRLRVMPNHSCLTAAMFDEYWVVEGETVVDRWPILRGR